MSNELTSAHTEGGMPIPILSKQLLALCTKSNVLCNWKGKVRTAVERRNGLLQQVAHTHRQRRCNDVDSEDRTRDLRIMGATRCQLRYIHLRHSVVSTIELVMSWKVFLFVHSCFDRRQSHNRTTTKPQPNHDQTTPNPRAEPGDILAGHCC